MEWALLICVCISLQTVKDVGEKKNENKKQIEETCKLHTSYIDSVQRSLTYAHQNQSH